jgi:O-acetyl-ADP-ribose deacetylase (regulator of RNase III)
MIYKEETRDLFSVPDDYYLAHCISADFGMGKGIAVEFNKHFDMKHNLQTKYPDYINEWHKHRYLGKCIVEGRVLNLVTKERYFHKPTYESMANALYEMMSMCVTNGITKVAMPIIGCGLDRLKWDRVSEMIQEIFFDIDIEILVCKQ